MKKIFKKGIFAIGLLFIAMTMLTVPVGAATAKSAQNGWVHVGGNYKYKLNGRYVKNRIQRIGNSYYYFDRQGNRQTGLQKYQNFQYYFLKNGKMVRNHYITISGQKYYVFRNGKIRKNCWYNGKYYNSKGKLVRNAVTYNASTRGRINKRILDEQRLANCSNLMIVAHPDDETLWGGAHLSDGGWFVVCLTNGYNEVREAEFQRAMKAWRCKGIILRYPDVRGGKRSDWKDFRKNIAKDIDTVLQYKRWRTVVTHNPDGEYGHIHHKLTNKIVTECYYKNSYNSNFYYFGKFYWNNALNQKKGSLRQISGQKAKRKQQIARRVYVSQKTAVDMFEHMIPYENWVRAENWN